MGGIGTNLPDVPASPVDGEPVAETALQNPDASADSHKFLLSAACMFVTGRLTKIASDFSCDLGVLLEAYRLHTHKPNDYTPENFVAEHAAAVVRGVEFEMKQSVQNGETFGGVIAASSALITEQTRKALEYVEQFGRTAQMLKMAKSQDS